MENLYVHLLCFALGSFDIQEDHSQEQCQEEEAVRGVYRDATVAHVIRGHFSMSVT